MDRLIICVHIILITAIDIKCDITQDHFPSLIQDNIVSCQLSAGENFISSIWKVSMSIQPVTAALRWIRTVPFNSDGE